MFELMDLLTMV